MLRSLVLATSLALAVPVLAQSEPPVVQEGETLVFTKLGHVLTMPLPDWLGEPVDLDQLETYDETSEREALIEFLPEAQEFESWGQLYWARVLLAPNIEIGQMRGFTIEGFSQICKEEETNYFTPDDDPSGGIAPLVFVCGAHEDGLGLDGLGEIMIAAYRKSGDGLALVTMEWRGPAFPVADLDAWPIPGNALMERARALDAAISLEAIE